MDEQRYTLRLTKLIEAEDLKIENFTKNVNTDEILIEQTEINRAGLQVTGYFEHFDNKRIQLIGKVESAYINKVYDDNGVSVLKKLIDQKVPCVVFSRGYVPTEELIPYAEEKGVALLGSHMATSIVMARIIRILSRELAPRISLHGVLVDVYGVGVLLMGESGIGKSEAALSLIRKGHRLVADDIVEIRHIGDNELTGRAPDITRNFIELRGIGIIDVKALFGVECVKESQSIDMIIKLEEWDPKKTYERIGSTNETMPILGQELECHTIPIRPGRNVSIIVESAAANHRLKKTTGYDAAAELYKRAQEEWNMDKCRETIK